MIRIRLLVGFVLIALLPLIGVGVATSLISYHNGRQQSIDRLESVAARKELAIQVWVQSLQQELLFVSQENVSPKFISTVLRLADENKVYPWYNNLVRKRLQGLVDQSSLFDELFLLDLQGKVLVSTDRAREGKVYQDWTVFQRGLIGPYTQLPFDGVVQFPREGNAIAKDRTSVIAMIPQQGQDRQSMGVIGGRADAKTLYAILEERTGLGETGNSYLVNVHHALLVETHLPEQQPASDNSERHSLDTAGIDAAIQQTASGSGVYAGSRGTSVIGIYRWLPDLQAVLWVEQELSDALRPVFATVRINLIIALVAVSIAVVASLFLTRSIADPIADLASTASQIAKGNLDHVVRVEREDEIGALARAFNSMTTQLRDLINSLEQRVAERTRAFQKANESLEQRALQLETSARVGREITSILDIDVLLTRVVDLIQDAFGYYHVQVFLVDRDANQLILRASSRRINSEYQRLDIAQRSVNSRAVQTGAALRIDDVSHDPGYLFDSKLPETRSELVVPLRLGDQVIGTLDVHNAQVNAFTEEDVTVIQSLGDQIAVAIENAHLYDQSRELAVLEERTRLARELHDSVTQSLYSVVLLAEGWRRQFIAGGADAQIENHLSRVVEIAQQALKEMRLLIHELRPPVLEQVGLVGALRHRLDAVENHVGIEGRVVMEDFIELPVCVEEGLYRITLEALNNALKHAMATREIVRLCLKEDTVVLEITDDGQGFDPGVVQHGGGMGLVNMRERARQLGGTLTIRSRRGEGTTVTVRVPIPLAD